MKLMALRYAGNCTTCGTRVEQGAQAWYDPATKVICTSCRPVDAQLGLDTMAPPGASPPQPTPTRSARSDLEKGTELEQRIAEAFAAAGYRIRTNVKQEGRSGSTHEVDVLAEKSDELLTLSVAIECKAWANPIEKDVIAKFNEVRRDLGLGHAVVVSLNGARPGATTLADELGIVVWGPDEIEPILGRASVVGLQNRPMVEEVGFPRRLAADDALDLVRRETSGTLGIGREEVVWSGNVWMPVSVVPLTLLKMKMVGRSTNTSQAWAVYDLIAGTFVCRDETEPPRTSVELDGGQLKARLKVVDPVKTLDKVSGKFEQVKSDAAIKKYRGQLAKLGVPDWHTATTGTPSPFLYPMFLAFARQKSGTERVVAIDAYRNRIDADLGVELSKQIAWVRESLAI